MSYPEDLLQPGASFFVPDGSNQQPALERTTHLGIGAHSDDLEFMALHGILECRGLDDRWFTGVTCTDGAGSPRAGGYADFTDTQMAETRRREQDEAADLGGYAAQFQLGYPEVISADRRPSLVADLAKILADTRPTVIYTHNPADKHPSHLAVTAAVIQALRQLPADARPQRVLGCEVWRDLDWLPDDAKVALDVSADPEFALRLARVFDSQITGGKRYDLAVAGRQLANATFFHPRSVDEASHVTFALDLTPLAEDPELDPLAFTLGFVDRFREDVEQQLGDAFK